MKKMIWVCAVSAVLVGSPLPVRAQSTLPVEVICARGGGIYRPICNHVKQAVRKSSLFRPAKNGNRYVVILYAETGYISGGGVDMSVSYGAVISDPLSETFPYHIAGIPWVFFPSESRELGSALVDGGLLLAVLAFEAVVGEINSSGYSQRQLDEATVGDLQRKMKSEIGRILKEGTD